MTPKSDLRPIHHNLKALLVGALLLAAADSLSADDWPQWMGPQRDGRYNESGTVEEIPEEGLPILWRTPIAGGYSGPAVADGRLFVTDYVMTSGRSTNNAGTRDQLTGSERVHCLDSKTGQLLWQYEYDRPYRLSFAAGPRATPTVDGEFVYVLGAEGDLLCLRCEDGELIWQKQLAEAYEAESPIWGHAAHPLVHGNLIYCLAGGVDSAVVALDKRTGQEVWHALSASNIGYCPPMIQKLSGTERLVIWHADSINALDPSTGETSWSFPLKPLYDMSIAAPQVRGNYLFANGIGETAVMLQLDSDGKPAETIWKGGSRKKAVYCANSTPIFDDGIIYGSDCGSGYFVAVNPQDGTRFWQTFSLTTSGTRPTSQGTAFITKHGDRYLIFAETGELIMAELSKEGFEELGRMQVLEPTNSYKGRDVVWSHPAYADRCMFARNDKEIVCVSLAAQP